LIDRIERFIGLASKQLNELNADPFIFHPGDVALPLNVVAFDQ
jgi:hypothetical protein